MIADAGDLRPTGSPEGGRKLLLGSEKAWFASALRALLKPEGFRLERAASADAVLSSVAGGAPDVVVLDGELPPGDPAELVRLLLDGPLPRSVPVLYRPDGGEGREAEVLEAGAWGLLEDPIRLTALVAQLERYLQIGRDLVRGTRERQYVDPETDVLTLTGLIRVLPALSNLARREGAPIAYTVIGPTETGSGELLEQQRRSTASLCRRHLRKSDFVGWLQDGSDLAVVAYGTSRSGAGGLARRLNEVTEKQTRAAELRYTLSAGILEVEPSRQGPESRNGDGGDHSPETELKLESLQALAAAQTALKQARRAGGGIRFVDTT